MAALEASSASAAGPPPGSGTDADGPAHPLPAQTKEAATADKQSSTSCEAPQPPLVHDYAFDFFDQATVVKGQQAALAHLLQQGRRTSTLSLLTKHLVATYEGCNPGHRFRYKVPRRVLTQPKEGTLNDGRDNCEANLICSVGDVLESPRGSFTILDLLGQGTFGQVFKCQLEGSTKPVAVKVVKNKPAYFRQAQSEVAVLKLLNEQHDPQDARHIVRLLDSFNDKNHLCLVFELLDMNLYELLKQNQFRGLPLSLIRHFVVQILSAMMVMEEAAIIHCDLKPENILLVAPAVSRAAKDAAGKKPKPLQNQVKVIDFGSACLEGHTTYTYIQSRFYRSPEVLLGLPYDMAIDLWSFGCICAEMFLGLPIFPGVSEHNQMSRIVEMLGPPADFMLDHGTNTSKYFKRVKPAPLTKIRSRESEGILHSDDDADHDPALEGRAVRPGKGGSSSSYVLKTAEEYAADTRTPVVNSKKYFKHKRLQDIIRSYPYGRKLSKEDTAKEDEERRVFLHFVLGLLELNPWKRWTAKQAADHPFVTGEPLDVPSFEAMDSISVRDRRLQSMLQAQQRLCAKDQLAGGDQQRTSKTGHDGHHSAASYASYLTAAAASTGRPAPSLLSRSSDPIDISHPHHGHHHHHAGSELPGPSSFDDPSTPYTPHHLLHTPHHYNSHHHVNNPAMRAGLMADDSLVRSAPHGTTRIPQRSTTRRSSIGQSLAGWHALDGSASGSSQGGYSVRASRGSFAGHKGGESYTYNEASDRATDFGYALQRPGAMMHFSPQQAGGYLSGGAYGGYGGDMMMVNGGRGGVAGSSPHANGLLGRSWGQQQQQHGGGGGGSFQPSSGGGSRGGPMRSPHQQQYLPMPPPQHMAPPAPPSYPAVFGGLEEEDVRHGGPYSPPPPPGDGGAGGLDTAMAEWDPFFPEGLDEDLAHDSSYSTQQQQGGGAGGRPGSSSGRTGGGPKGSTTPGGGKDSYYGVSPKQQHQPNGHGMGRGHSPHHGPQQQQPFNTPPRFYRGPLSGASGGGRGGPPSSHHRHRSAFSNSPQSWKFQQPGSYSSGGRHRSASSWHQPSEVQPHSLPDSLSKMPPPPPPKMAMEGLDVQPPHGSSFGGANTPLQQQHAYWGNGPRRRSVGASDSPFQQQQQGGGAGKAGGRPGGQGMHVGSWGRRGQGMMAHAAPSGLAQELQPGTSPSSLGAVAEQTAVPPTVDEAGNSSSRR